MCAIYGFLDYGKKVSNKVLKNIIKELSIAAECRGTDATGISYVNDGEIITFKQPKPAHKMKLYFPKGTTAVIGHNRLTTQGNEKLNYNNHPFEGTTSQHSFALAHNGVLYNDKEVRREKRLPDTHIETDSYVAAQFLEQAESIDMDSVKNMAEVVDGSFVFTILRDDNTLFLVKGSNPITLYHFPTVGLYVYASTTDILNKALKSARFTEPFKEVRMITGDIVYINADGKISFDNFEYMENYCLRDWYDYYNFTMFDEDDDLLSICNCYGVDREDVEFLYACGYTAYEIEEMLLDTDFFEETLKEAKTLAQCEI